MYAPVGMGSNLPEMNLTIRHDLKIVPAEENKYEGYTGVMRTIHLDSKEYRVWYYVSNEYILSEVRVTTNEKGKLLSERVSVKDVRDNPSILLGDSKFLDNLEKTIVKMKNYACAYGLGQNQEFRSLALIGKDIKFKYFDQTTETFSIKTKPALDSLNEELKRPQLDKKMANLLVILQEDVLEKRMAAATKMQTITSNKPEAEIEYIKNVRDHTYETKVFAQIPDPQKDSDLDGFMVIDANPLTDQVEKTISELEEGMVVPKQEISFWKRLKFLLTGDEATLVQKKFRERQDARNNEAKAKAPLEPNEERRPVGAPEKELRVLPAIDLRIEEEAQASEDDALHLPKLKPVGESANDYMPDVVPRNILEPRASSEEEPIKEMMQPPLPPPRKAPPKLEEVAEKPTPVVSANSLHDQIKRGRQLKPVASKEQPPQNNSVVAPAVKKAAEKPAPAKNDNKSLLEHVLVEKMAERRAVIQPKEDDKESKNEWKS